MSPHFSVAQSKQSGTMDVIKEECLKCSGHFFNSVTGERESKGLSGVNGLKLNPIRAGLTLAASSCVALLMSVSLTARIWSPLRNLKKS